MSTFYGYQAAGIQSAVYTILMEHAINPNLKSDAAVVLLSGLLGGLAGIPFVLSSVWDSPLFIAIGVLAGVVVGFALRKMFIKAANSALQPTHEARG